MYNLTEGLKTSVKVGGVSYPVNTDFRVWLKISELMEDSTPENIAKAIILCYRGGFFPPSLDDAVAGLVQFINGEDVEKSRGKGKKVMDFQKDSALIFASFLYDFGIDLTECDMHWHKFLMLLKNLSQASPLMRVVQIRSMKTDDIQDRKKRDEIIRLKRAYALEDPGAEDLDRLWEMM